MVEFRPIAHHIRGGSEPTRLCDGRPRRTTYPPWRWTPCAKPGPRPPSAPIACAGRGSLPSTYGNPGRSRASLPWPTSTPPRCRTTSTIYATAPAAGRTPTTGAARTGRRPGRQCAPCKGRPGVSPGELRSSRRRPAASQQPSSSSPTARWGTSPGEPRRGARPGRSPARRCRRPAGSWKAEELP